MCVVEEVINTKDKELRSCKVGAVCVCVGGMNLMSRGIDALQMLVGSAGEIPSVKTNPV